MSIKTSQEVIVKNRINPAIPAILSFLIPGGGQISVGNVKKGVIFFILAVILQYILGYFTVMLGIPSFYIPYSPWIWSYLSIVEFIFILYIAFDAYKMAILYNETGKVPQAMFLL